MNICILSGSARHNNNTIRVAKAIQHNLSAHTVSLIDFEEYDIPLINQGSITPDTLSAFQQSLCDAMQAAHLVFLISPEYNWSTTPEILNFLHRFGDKPFAGVFNEKVFALVGVSTGKGGKTPALHLTSILNKIISFLNLQSVVSPKIFESHYTKEVLDEHGHSLGNALYDKGLSDFINYNVNVAERWKK
ncbi:MAG: NAD(P)H-dependent oxidoreductase [Bacteroidota bacterium]|jgi:chromate reductase